MCRLRADCGWETDLVYLAIIYVGSMREMNIQKERADPAYHFMLDWSNTGRDCRVDTCIQWILCPRVTDLDCSPHRRPLVTSLPSKSISAPPPRLVPTPQIGKNG